MVFSLNLFLVSISDVSAVKGGSSGLLDGGTCTGSTSAKSLLSSWSHLSWGSLDCILRPHEAVSALKSEDTIDLSDLPRAEGSAKGISPVKPRALFGSESSDALLLGQQEGTDTHVEQVPIDMSLTFQNPLKEATASTSWQSKAQRHIPPVIDEVPEEVVPMYPAPRVYFQMTETLTGELCPGMKIFKGKYMFDILDVGRGGFGVVHKAKVIRHEYLPKSMPTEVAMKSIIVKSEVDALALVKEIEVLKELSEKRQDGVVYLFEAYVFANGGCLVTEFLPRTLHEVLARHSNQPISKILSQIPYDAPDHIKSSLKAAGEVQINPVVRDLAGPEWEAMVDQPAGLGLKDADGSPIEHSWLEILSGLTDMDGSRFLKLMQPEASKAFFDNLLSPFFLTETDVPLEISVRRYLRRVGEILQDLHADHIAHFDIEERNIMIDENGRVKLIDTGFAEHYRLNSKGTAMWIPCGTSGYKYSDWVYDKDNVLDILGNKVKFAYVNPEKADMYSFSMTAFASLHAFQAWPWAPKRGCKVLGAPALLPVAAFRVSEAYEQFIKKAIVKRGSLNSFSELMQLSWFTLPEEKLLKQAANRAFENIRDDGNLLRLSRVIVGSCPAVEAWNSRMVVESSFARVFPKLVTTWPVPAMVKVPTRNGGGLARRRSR